MKRFSILILNVFITLIAVSGQDVVVTASFDTSAIYIGDQIKYTITVDQPADVTLSLPSFIDTLVKNIDIIAGPVSDSVKKDGRIMITDQYLITSFDSGFYQLNPVYAELKNEEGIRRFYSDYTQLEVNRVNIAPADTTAKIYDIIEPYRAPLTVGEMLPWILAALLLAVIIWFAIKYIKRIRSSKSPEETIINPDPAHVIAFRELEKLREEQLWQKGEIKYYYTRLTEILRQYLENRFGVFSLELTTSETLDALVKSGFKKDASYNILKTILTGADLVKFAKHKPEVAEHEVHFQNSFDFVKATMKDEMLANESAVSEKRKEEEV
jgi:uncharacterized repeat protein (TIGR01451 family)